MSSSDLRRLSLAAALLVSLLAPPLAFPVVARAQGAPSPATGATGAASTAGDAALGFRTLHAARASGTIHLDGVLDEAAWARVPAAGDFRQSWPHDGAPATERTEVRVLYDDDALYVGVRLYDSRPDSIASQLARRDITGIYSDWVHVVIDSYHDRRTAFRFSVNPKGVQKDVRHFDDTNEDLNWDAVWQVATAVDREGWVAEYRIPFSQLRFNRCRAETAVSAMNAPSGVGGHVEGAGSGAAADAANGTPPGAASGCTWGINVQRDLARRGERSGWSYVPQNANGYVSRMGDLDGIGGIPRPGRLEILPYVSSTLTRDTVQSGNPFYRRNAGALSAGADFKYGLTPGLTINGTINPDFGQVELDPAVVNLTQFENFFPERRPFFVEGADLFRFGDSRSYNNFGFGQFFYSRRIGRAPQRGVGEVDVRGDAPAGRTVVERSVLFDDPPQTTTILGAAKLSGKTAGGWTVAVLDAVTARETAPFEQELVTVDPAGADTTRVLGRHRAPVEPLTNYLVARTRRDLNGGRSVVGALVTGVNRQLDDVFVPQLRSSAYSGGVDFDHTWSDRTWSLSGFLAGSRLNGDSLAIIRAQRSFVRYYQRPDADYLRVDSTRRSLSGYQSSLALTKTGGRHWIGSLALQAASPGFEVNDVGFQQSTDRRAVATYVEYRENTAGPRFRNYGVFAWSSHAYNFGGDNVFQAVTAGTYAQLVNFWNVNGQLRYDPAYYRDRLTRGGVLMQNPVGWSVSGGVSSDSRKPLIVGLNYFDREDVTPGFDRTFGVSLDARPTSFVRVVFEPNLTRSVNPFQWLDARSAPAMTATGGRREIFSDVSTTELSFPLRVNWTFTPRLSLEVVAQPLVSANHFYDFKQLRAARTYDFQAFGRDVGTIAGSDAAGYTVNVDGETIDIGPLDFTQRSLRGSAVMRWEYRPGSALFFVWQQTRDGAPAFGDFSAGRDVGAVFREKERNVFVVKGTWWVAR